VAVKPPVLLFSELKSDLGECTPEQEAWLAALGACTRVSVGCCGEVTWGLLLAACALLPAVLAVFSWNSNRREGRRERGLGRGKLGPLVPTP
jgi:hypothetical protein